MPGTLGRLCIAVAQAGDNTIAPEGAEVLEPEDRTFLSTAPRGQYPVCLDVPTGDGPAGTRSTGGGVSISR